MRLSLQAMLFLRTALPLVALASILMLAVMHPVRVQSDEKGRGNAFADERQTCMANAIVDKYIANIMALKSKYPELARFGQSPEFKRRDGEFRYDYKVIHTVVDGRIQVRVLPGGCSIYYRIASADSQGAAPPDSDWISLNGGHTSSGSFSFGHGFFTSQAISVYQKSDDDTANAPLRDSVSRAINDPSYLAIVGEYELSERHVALDNDALLAALETRKWILSMDVFLVLPYRTLTPKQLAWLRQGLVEEKFLLEYTASALDLIQKQDPASWEKARGDLIRLAFKAENTQTSIWESGPLPGSPWTTPRRIRGHVLKLLRDGEPADLEIAGALLSSDTGTDNRLTALDYIARQKGDPARKLLLGALENSHRSVQAKAAALVGEGKMTDGADGLHRLLGSSSLNVRTAANAALIQLGLPATDVTPLPPLPDSARQMAATLGQRGFNDGDILQSHLLPFDEKTTPLPKIDAAWIKKETAKYEAATVSPYYYTRWMTIPGQFLLATALKLKDEETARLLYAKLCDSFETDDIALACATETLVWNRFSVGLDHFHKKEDSAAQVSFEKVLQFSDQARPGTFLGEYVRQSQELLGYLKAKTPEPPSLPPDKSNAAAWSRYWIARLKDCDGDRPSPEGENIRQAGLAALPSLIDALSDQTPTRNRTYWRHYLPTRGIVHIGDAAKDIIRVIAGDYGLKPPALEGTEETPAKRQATLRKWLATVPPGSRPVAVEKRERKLDYPVGRYEWGED